jgi:GDP-4-dehydro-6-deoxy-D-mannose reductase
VCDVTDRHTVTGVVRSVNPDYVFHLAAQAQISASWDDPEGTYRTNVLGTLFLLEALREAQPRAVVQIAGSSAEYGARTPDELPISEECEPHPQSPYAASKTAAVHLGRLYSARYEMRVHCIRPFQFIGPGKYPDACSHFARSIVEIERRQCDELRVGNLEIVRDMLDVHDGVRAMWLIAQTGRVGETYNISAGVGYRIRDVLEKLMTLAGSEARIREDPSRFRPVDEPAIVGDNRKLRALGWRQEIPLEDTLAKILDYWRRSA